MDQTKALAEDMLADILSRLRPRDLAVSRCARKGWQAIVDNHSMLICHVLPCLFDNYSNHTCTALLLRWPLINAAAARDHRL
jgi:hypothetical protein